MPDMNERTKCWRCNQFDSIERYNGWHNYETWAVNLWLTNDPFCYEQLMSIVQNPDTLWEQAEALKNWLHIGLGNMAEEPDPDITAVTGMYVDLLASAFDMVDWSEIIQNKQEGGA